MTTAEAYIFNLLFKILAFSKSSSFLDIYFSVSLDILDAISPP